MGRTGLAGRIAHFFIDSKLTPLLVLASLLLGGFAVVMPPREEEPQIAVPMIVAKRKGTNAIQIAERVLEKVEALKGRLIPAQVEVTVTRNYGQTATEKSDELLFHMGLAMLSVVALIWLALGWRESGVVEVASLLLSRMAVPVLCYLTARRPK